MLSLSRAAARLLAPALVVLTVPALPGTAAAAEPLVTTGWSVDVAPTTSTFGWSPSTSIVQATSVVAVADRPGVIRWWGPDSAARLGAPDGRRLVTGETFVAQGVPAAGEGLLDVPTSCAGLPAQVGTEKAAVRVLDVAYDAGDIPTRLVASYDGACAGTPEIRIAGVLRIAAEAPWVAAAMARQEMRQLASAVDVPVTTTVAVTSRGPSTTVAGAATLTGRHAAEYSVVTDGCAGRTLAPTDRCDVVLSFRPAALGSRPALLSVPMSDHPRAEGALLALSGSGVLPPSPPDVLRAFASVDGAGIAWKGPGSEYASRYLVYRETGDGPVRVGEVTGTEHLFLKPFVDTTLPAGASGRYSVAAVGDGGEGSRSAEIVVRRLADAPLTGTTRAIAAEAERLPTTAVSADTRRGDTVIVQPGWISGSSTGNASAQLRFPPLPGPGTYAIDPASDDASTGRVRVELGLHSSVCTLDSGTLRVDDVAYDAALKPVVLAAEVTGQCSTLGTWRAVVRWDSPRPYRAAAVTPELSAQAVAGTAAEPVTLTVTNRGDLPLTPGAPSLDGAGAPLWAVDRGSCANPVPVSGSCTMQLTFSPTSGDATGARLSTPLDTASGGWATSLSGQGIVPPGAPVLHTVHTVTGGVELRWHNPADWIWIPHTFTVHRTVQGRTTVIGTTGGSEFLDRSPVDGATYAVSAANVAGTGPLSNSMGVYRDPGSGFHAVTPVRLLDTRSGVGAPKGAVGPAGSVRLRVTGLAGVPFGAKAVALNVTAVGATANGFVTVHPAGGTRPEASSLNTTKGLVTPNLVVVKIGSTGEVDLYNSSGSVHLLADLAGYYIDTTSAPKYLPRSPSRVLDTRNGTGAPRGAVRGGSAVRVKVTDLPGAPLDPTAVVMNVTAVGATAHGFVTAYPSGTFLPPVSNLNTTPGLVTPNLVVVPIGSDGSVDLYSSSGTVHLLADVAGFYAADNPAGFHALAPKRLLDTRIGLGAPRAAVAGGRAIGLRVTDVGGVPATGVTAVVLNVTAVGATADGFVTAHPAGTTRPEASNLNTARGRVTPNLVVVKVGSGGVVDLYNSIGNVHLLADVAGYYTS